MKRIVLSVLTAAIAATVATAAFANQAPDVNRRAAHQRHRIVEGRRCGALTRGESRRLMRGQRHLARMERRARADGVVTPREHRRLERGLDRQSARIWRLKHNARHARVASTSRTLSASASRANGF